MRTWLFHDPKWGGLNLKWMKPPALRFDHFTPTPLLLLRLRPNEGIIA